MNFDQAFDILMRFEGSYSDHAADKGGPTKYGITISVARQNGYTGEMRDLPQSLAKLIYKKSYWDAVKADLLPDVIRYDVFDAAVNSGVGRATQWLQMAVGTAVDGVIGSQTLEAAANCKNLKGKFNGMRLSFMTGLGNWDVFSRGWARRVADVMAMEA